MGKQQTALFYNKYVVVVEARRRSGVVPLGLFWKFERTSNLGITPFVIQHMLSI